MFAFGVLIVAGLNLYAVVRVPDLVSFSEVENNIQNVIRVEGELVSWTEDPYSDGSDLKNLLLREPTTDTVLRVKWTETRPDMPPIGSIIQVTGDVTAYRGSIYLNAAGFGAIEILEVREASTATLSDIAHDPSNYTDSAVEIQGFIGSTLEPWENYQSLSLQDHPSYANSLTSLYMVVLGYPSDWVEAGAEIKASGIVVYDSKAAKWKFQIRAEELTVLTIGTRITLNWASEPSSWSYEIGKAVVVEGRAINESSSWRIERQDGIASICFLPGPDDLANATSLGLNNWIGRLVWSDSGEICLDRTTDANRAPTIEEESIPSDYNATHSLFHITRNPEQYLNGSHEVILHGYNSYSLKGQDDSGYLMDQVYPNTKARLSFELEKPRSEEIHAESDTIMGGKISWDSYYSRLKFTVQWIIILNDAEPTTLAWDGMSRWSYAVGEKVHIEGILEGSESIGWTLSDATRTKTAKVELDNVSSVEGDVGGVHLWSAILAEELDEEEALIRFVFEQPKTVDNST